MSSRWPQDQQELGWPRAPQDDAWPPAGDAGNGGPDPAGAGGGSVDPWSAGEGFGDPWGGGPARASWDAPPVADAGPGGRGRWTGGHDAASQAQPAGPAVPPRRRERQPDPQPGPGVDGDDEYDWYRYLSRGGNAPSHHTDPDDPVPDGAAPRSGRLGRAPRAARKSRDERKDHAETKNRDERKLRRDRKNRGPGDDQLTARQAADGDAAHPDETGPQRAGAPGGYASPAAYADPAGGAVDTGPGGWGAYPGEEPRRAGAAAYDGPPAYADPVNAAADTGPAGGWGGYAGGFGPRAGAAAYDAPAAYADPAGDAADTGRGGGWGAHPGEAGGYGGPAAYAGRAGDAVDTGPGGGWRGYPQSGAGGYGGPAAYAGPAGDAAYTGPGGGWGAHPGADPAGPDFRPSYPGHPARPDETGPNTQHHAVRDPAAGRGVAEQAYLPPRGYEQPADASDVHGYGGDEYVPEPAAAQAAARRPAKRGKKALRPPAARAVRRAAHPDVIERARLAAAAGGTARAGLAAPPDVAERPIQPVRPVGQPRPASPGRPVNPEVPARPERSARRERPGGAGQRGGTEHPVTADRSAAGQGGAGRPAGPGRSARGGKRLRRRARWLMAGAVVIVVAAAALLLWPGSGPAHVLVIPARLGTYVKEPHLAKVMEAGNLQQEIVTKSAGEAKHVVYAVYEDSTGTAASSGPQIVLLIGGNLTGTSPDGFITSFIGQARGAQRTSAGPMGGDAACISRVPGSVAECAWADNDTFGVVASPTLSVPALAAMLRAARSQAERPVQ
jgi:hypothetical protein